MKYVVDGDQLMICANSFTNLQESPAIFIPLDGELAQAILAEIQLIKLDHITAPPAVDDFNALVDCINALAEMVTA